MHAERLRERTIAVVGATGAVGLEMLDILGSAGVPADRVRPLASARSAGRELAYAGGTVRVAELSEPALGGADLALFAASSDAAREWAPQVIAAGTDVVDNSSAFRMDPNVPLVVPEINAGTIPQSSPGGRGRLVANPNCSTIIMLMALTPIHRRFGCERLVVSTYQAVSGAGAAAIDELLGQTRDVLRGDDPRPDVFGEPCAFNVFSHDSAIDPETGRNTEEDKLIRETRKIWGDDSVSVTATCVRVPVVRAHTETVNVTLRTPAAEAELRESLAGAPGIEVVDDRAANRFPTPLRASGRDAVLVGRIRPDAGESPDADGRYRRFDLMCCGDQIRKGAALNAVQIAGLL